MTAATTEFGMTQRSGLLSTQPEVADSSDSSGELFQPDVQLQRLCMAATREPAASGRSVGKFSNLGSLSKPRPNASSRRCADLSPMRRARPLACCGPGDPASALGEQAADAGLGLHGLNRATEGPETALPRSNEWNTNERAGPGVLACESLRRRPIHRTGHTVGSVDGMGGSSSRPAGAVLLLLLDLLLGGHRFAAALIELRAAPTPRCTIRALLTWLRVSCWLGAWVTPRTPAGSAVTAAWAGAARPSPVPISTAVDAAMDRWAFFCVVLFM